MEDYKLMEIEAASTYTLQIVGYEEGDRDVAHEFTVLMSVIEMRHNHGWKTYHYDFHLFGADYGWDDDGEHTIVVNSGDRYGNHGKLDNKDIDIIVRELAANALYNEKTEHVEWTQFFDSIEYMNEKSMVSHMVAA